MMFFTLAALFAPQWTQSVHSGDRHASSSQCWWIEAIGSCPFVPITSARICRPRRANKFRSACKKPITNRTRSGWKENERANRNSGERTRPAWWRARPRDRGLFFDVHNFRRVDTQAKFVSARLRNQHARRVRSPNMTTRWTRKDLLGLRELSADEINFVLDTANAFKQVGTREIKKVPALRGKTLVNFFVEPSTRTRTSFELAAFRLSADVINISAMTSSLTKGETLKDTARNLEALHADILVLRHSSAGAPQFLANRLKASVINAGDGAHEHPTQALLDLYTIRERRGKIAGLHVAIIGDILFSRVARSNIFGLLKLGARVTLVGPSTLVPRDFEKLGVEVSYKIDDVLPKADVVNLLRIQHERQRREYFPGLGEYIRLFGLTKERAKLLKPECLIMHPGPINRGVEIDSDVADGLQSVILDQVTNGLAIRMAVLYLCGGIST